MLALGTDNGATVRETACRPILIIDDDQPVRAALAEQLAVEGEFSPTEAETASEAEAKITARDARFDALLLGMRLPDRDGRDLCAQLRLHGIKVPIILLSGPDQESEVVRGLESGANDCVAKPFRMAELRARLRAQLRIFENSEDAVFTVGPYTFRSAARLLESPEHNWRILLTGKEAAMLKFLYRAGNRPVSKQVLLDEVWGYNSSTSTHTLETHIYRLRQKMEPDPSNATILVTNGGGYRLNSKGTPLAAVPRGTTGRA